MNELIDEVCNLLKDTLRKVEDGEFDVNQITELIKKLGAETENEEIDPEFVEMLFRGWFVSTFLDPKEENITRCPMCQCDLNKTEKL